MNISFDLEIALQLIISFGVGTAIGFEREYRSKAAGLRTMIMICLGSTVFTELSILLGGSTSDRIASNVVTGVGFLGAGVIFKDGLNVSGLTTASTIWICAALGMAVGAGEYFIAIISTGVVVIVLSLFHSVQHFIERHHQTRLYRISYSKAHDLQAIVAAWLTNQKIEYRKKKLLKEDNQLIVLVEVYGNEKQMETFTQFLLNQEMILGFEF